MHDIRFRQTILAILVLGSGCAGSGQVPETPNVVEREKALPPVSIGPTAETSLEPSLLPSDTDSAHVDESRPGAKTDFLFRARFGETWELYESWSRATRRDIRRWSGLRRSGCVISGKQYTLRLPPDVLERFVRLREEHHRTTAEEFFRRNEVTRIDTYVIRRGETAQAVAARGKNRAPRWLLEQVNPTVRLGKLRQGDTVNVPIVRAASPVGERGALERLTAFERARGHSGQGWSSSDSGAGSPNRNSLSLRIPPRNSRREHVVESPGTGGTWFSDDEDDVEVVTEPEPPVEPYELTMNIRSGETLTLVSLWSGVSVRELQSYNRVQNARRIQVGQQLRIPMPEARATSFWRARREHHAR